MKERTRSRTMWIGDEFVCAVPTGPVEQHVRIWFWEVKKHLRLGSTITWRIEGLGRFWDRLRPIVS